MTDSLRPNHHARHGNWAMERTIEPEMLPPLPWRRHSGRQGESRREEWDGRLPDVPQHEMSTLPGSLPLDWADRCVSTGHRMRSALRGLIETIIPAIVVALLINLFAAQATRVYGQSMEPTLHADQRLVVEKVSYSNWLHLRSPERGDVVVLRVNGAGDLLIKRVVGLPGDQVEILDGQVFVNHQPLDEPYVVLPASGNYGPVDIPPLNLFVMGDNRDFSSDSRAFGPVPIEDVVGRAWLSYWPPESWGPAR